MTAHRCSTCSKRHNSLHRNQENNVQERDASANKEEAETSDMANNAPIMLPFIVSFKMHLLAFFKQGTKLGGQSICRSRAQETVIFPHFLPPITGVPNVALFKAFCPCKELGEEK
jgi:hypothetical protein